MNKRSKIFDITVPLKQGIPIWPNSPGFSRTWIQNIHKVGDASVSQLSIESHTATHIDAPAHFVKNGTTIESIPLETLVGDAVVIEIKGVKRITSEHLMAANIPLTTQRLLIKTDNDRYWNNEVHPFKQDFAALTKDAAHWLVNQKILLVGIDYLSIQIFTDQPDTHLILLNNNVIILETINLSKIVPGKYELYCMPLLVVGAEAAPARVILKSIDE
ncbi:MAG: cyclase family protein [Chitinophagales bacterium]